MQALTISYESGENVSERGFPLIQILFTNYSRRSKKNNNGLKLRKNLSNVGQDKKM